MDEDAEKEPVESLEAENEPQAVDEAEQAIPHKDPEDLESNGDESSRNADDTEILDDENGQPDAESEESQPHFALNDSFGPSKVSLNGMHRDEDSSHPRWRRRKKHVFVVSSAGKPIFTRYGDEDKLNPLFGVMCSLVSFMTQHDDIPRVVFAGDHKIVFLIRGPIYLIMVSRTKEPTPHMARQLQFLYTQLVSILTRKGLEHVFKRKHGFDLRNLLGLSGEQVLSHLVGSMDAHKFSSSLPLHTSMSFVLGAPACARLSPNLRNEVNKALLSVRNPHLIYAVLLAKEQLVQFVRPRKTALWAEDLLLIINLVNSSESFKQSEGTWTPLCLPLYSPDANVFAYICFLHKHSAPDVCLVLIAGSDNEFFGLSESKETVAKILDANGSLAQLQKSALSPPFNMSELQQAPTNVSRNVFHFVYFSTSMNQFVAPAFSKVHGDRQSQQRLIRGYQNLAFWVHGHDRKNKLTLSTDSHQTILSWIDRDVELYVALSPFMSKTTALAACNKILKWVKREESSLFITPQMW